LNQPAEAWWLSQRDEIRIRMDSDCATKGNQCSGEGGTPNLSYGASVTASKGSVRVERTIEAMVNTHC